MVIFQLQSTHSPLSISLVQLSISLESLCHITPQCHLIATHLQLQSTHLNFVNIFVGTSILKIPVGSNSIHETNILVGSVIVVPVWYFVHFVIVELIFGSVNILVVLSKAMEMKFKARAMEFVVKLSLGKL